MIFAQIYKKIYGRFLLSRLKSQRQHAGQDTYVFFDNLSSKMTEEIDAFTLFEYCGANGLPAVYIAVRGGNLYQKMGGQEADGIYFVENEKGNWVLRKDLFAVTLRAKAVVTSFGCICGPLERFFRKSPNIEYICIGHGTAFFRDSYLKGYYMSPRRYDRMLISNEYERKLLLENGWQDEKLIKAGLPRWDRLAAGKNSGVKKIFIFFSWRNTFQQTKTDIGEFEYTKKIKMFLTSERLKKIREKYGVRFYMGAHHALLDQCGIDLLPLTAGLVEFVDNDKISGSIADSSLLLTDFSSVFADFYFQNKPVIFYRLDENDAKLSEGEKADFAAIASQTRKIYNVLSGEDAVFDRLEYYIKQNFAMDDEEREKAKAFFYTKKNICAQIMREIIKNQ